MGLFSVEGTFLEIVFKNSLYSGVFAMAVGLILVLIVSLFTKKTLPRNIEAKFECYDEQVVTTRNDSLG